MEMKRQTMTKTMGNNKKFNKFCIELNLDKWNKWKSWKQWNEWKLRKEWNEWKH